MPLINVARRWFGGEDATAWSISFDAVEAEDHAHETEVTENPVEVGVAMSDHAYDKPSRLTVTAVVSNIPPAGKENDAFAANGDARALVAYARLRQLQKAHEPFSVQTGLDLFPSMMITSLKAKVDKDHGQVLYFVADMREVVWVTTEVVLFPIKAKKKAAAKKKDDGQKGSEEPDDALKKKVKKSLLKTALDYATGGGA